MLKLTDVDTFYGPIHALKKVSLSVEEKEIVSLLGGNACGKSTTMKTILGLVKPRQGRIEFLGKRIDRLPPSIIVRSGISPVLEARRLFPYLTVYENLLMGAYTRTDSSEIRKDIVPEYARQIILGAIEHLCLPLVVFDREFSSDDITDEACKIIFNGIGAVPSHAM